LSHCLRLCAIFPPPACMDIIRKSDFRDEMGLARSGPMSSPIGLDAVPKSVVPVDVHTTLTALRRGRPLRSAVLPFAARPQSRDGGTCNTVP
jgi:hypothetical protein